LWYFRISRVTIYRDEGPCSNVQSTCVLSIILSQTNSQAEFLPLHAAVTVVLNLYSHMPHTTTCPNKKHKLSLESLWSYFRHWIGVSTTSYNAAASFKLRDCDLWAIWWRCTWISWANVPIPRGATPKILSPCVSPEDAGAHTTVPEKSNPRFLRFSSKFI